MREADLSMIREIERRAAKKFCTKNKILTACWQKIPEGLDPLEYQDMITDFWRDRLPE